MDLYLVRHGIAELRGAKPDDERALTSEGIERTAQVAQGLLRLDCKPDIVATSPLRRAAETAEIMREVLRPDADVDIEKLLSPGASASELADWLSGLKAGSVMAVGHNPDMPMIAAEMIAGSSPVEIEFKKAAVCMLSFNGRPGLGKGVLRWLLQPKQLRYIGSG